LCYNEHMLVGTRRIELHLPGRRSLKEKRSTLKSLVAGLHKQFNISCAEIDLHDVWQSSTLGVAVVSTSSAHAESTLENVVRWIENNRPDVLVVDHYVELVR
jgi:uncharacterized protein YlxP (DUF503 family)